MSDPTHERSPRSGDTELSLGRRRFFRLGGATILGAALLAACSDDGDDDADDDGSPGTTTARRGARLDLRLARTAASIEALAVSTYATAAGTGKVSDPTVAAALALFADHHKQHHAGFNGIVTAGGGTAVTEPNPALVAALVQPVMSKPDVSQADIVKLAYDLETMAAQTYSYASTVLSTPASRATIMTIGGIEARHAAFIGSLALKLTPTEIFPASFTKAENPLPAQALVE